MYLEIYAANLTHGGAVVTASSLLDGLIEIIQAGGVTWIDRIDVVLSPQVAANLPPAAFIDPTSRIRLTVREDRPRRALFKGSQPNVDVRFAVFGPEYVRSRAGVNVVGFADGTLIPSWNSGKLRTPYSPKLMGIARNAIKRRILDRYDAYVVQTIGMAEALAERFPSKPVSVLPNLLGRPFLHPGSRQNLLLPIHQPGDARFFYPAKGYPHKNHRILAEVSRHYRESFGERLSFVVTLSPQELSAVIPSTCPDILNVGQVPAAALPSLYEQTDGLFFPSLNETFSSAPLEAAFMRRPVIASGLPYIQDLMEDGATYFNPRDPREAAQAIKSVVARQTAGSRELATKLDSAEAWARSHADPAALADELFGFFKKLSSAQA